MTRPSSRILALMADPTRYTDPAGLGPPRLLALPAYFDTRTVVMFDLNVLNAFTNRYNLIGLVEQSDRIEATLQVCAWRSDQTDILDLPSTATGRHDDNHSDAH